MTTPDPSIPWLVALSKPETRPQVVAELARHVGAEALFLLVPDAEAGTLLAAPGLPQTLPDGLTERCPPGTYPRQLSWPDASSLTPATQLVMEDGTTFVFVGEPLQLDKLDLRLLVLVGALLQAEQTAATTMARANEFLATLGHELRNPLAPIVTALHLLKMRHKRDTPQEVQVIERQVTNVIRLVDDLLDISRIARGKVELEIVPIEVSAVAARAVEMIAPMLQHRQHQLQVEVPADGLMVEGDEGRLVQVLTNLLTNAARYTPPGGHIRLAARHVGGMGVAETVEITVADSGIGIEPEMLPQIFDLFVQGGRSREPVGGGGLGIGLALVRDLVHLHGGTVSARNHGPDERGCTFTVRLPRHSV